MAGSAGRLSGEGATAETTAALIKDLRKSRLGAGFADWVEANSPQLLANPKLRPAPAPGAGGSASAAAGRASPAAPPSSAPPAQRPRTAAPAAEPPITAQSKANKGVFGEAKADAHMAAKDGYSKLNGKLTEIGDAGHPARARHRRCVGERKPTAGVCDQRGQVRQLAVVHAQGRHPADERQMGR